MAKAKNATSKPAEPKAKPKAETKKCVLEKRVTRLEAVVMILEKQMGIYLDRDGTIGGYVNSGLMAIVGSVSMVMLMAGICYGVLPKTGAGIAPDRIYVDTMAVSNNGTIVTEAGIFAAGDISTEGSITASGGITGTSTGGGTGVVSTAVVTESDVGNTRQTTITIDDLPVLVAFGGPTTNHVGGAKIWVAPEGRILYHGVTVANVTMATNPVITAAEGGDYSCGTTIGASTGLVTTAVDLCPKTSIDPWTNIVSAALASSAQFDGTTTAKDFYFNLEVDTADITATTTAIVDSATITITWSQLGDY